MPTSTPKPRRARKNGAGGAAPDRRRHCYFCAAKIDDINFTDVAALSRTVSEKGKIRSRRVTGTCRKHQVQLAVAIKRAREMALLPNVNR